MVGDGRQQLTKGDGDEDDSFIVDVDVSSRRTDPDHDVVDVVDVVVALGALDVVEITSLMSRSTDHIDMVTTTEHGRCPTTCAKR